MGASLLAMASTETTQNLKSAHNPANNEVQQRRPKQAPKPGVERRRQRPVRHQPPIRRRQPGGHTADGAGQPAKHHRRARVIQRAVSLYWVLHGNKKNFNLSFKKIEIINALFSKNKIQTLTHASHRSDRPKYQYQRITYRKIPSK